MIIWDVTSGAKLHTLKGHTDDIFNVAFSPDGREIVSGSDNEEIVWDGTSGDELRRLTYHKDYGSDPFSSNDKQILPEADNVEMFVWDALSGQPLPGERWEMVEFLKRTSNDGRWLLNFFENQVLLIDLQFKNRSYEKAFRQSKAEPNLDWHVRQIKKAKAEKNWFAILLHRAWIWKTDSKYNRFNEAFLNEAFLTAYEKLVEQNKQSKTKQVFPKVAEEVNQLIQQPSN